MANKGLTNKRNRETKVEVSLTILDLLFLLLGDAFWGTRNHIYIERQSRRRFWLELHRI